jgi:hypothetical protein
MESYKQARTKMQAYDVYLNGKCIDTVFFNKKGIDAEYVKSALINHDGYDDRIIVRKVK